MNILFPRTKGKIEQFIAAWATAELPADKTQLETLLAEARQHERTLMPSGGFPDPILLADLGVPLTRIAHALESIASMEQRIVEKATEKAVATTAAKSTTPAFNLEALDEAEARIKEKLARAVPGTARHEQLTRRLVALKAAKDVWLGKAVEQNLQYVGPTARLKARIAARKQK
jgi:hypothetical protein